MNDTTAKADPVRSLVGEWRAGAKKIREAGDEFGDGMHVRFAAIADAFANELQAALAQQAGADLDRYDAGLLSDFGGGNVEWWQDYIRAELDRAHDHYTSQAAPQPAIPEDDEDGLPTGFARFYTKAFRNRHADTSHFADCEEVWRAALAQHNREGE